MTDADREAWTRNTMADLRANGGTPSFGPLAGRPLAIMTTKGAKSGLDRTVIVTYHCDGDDYVIAATKGGSPENPDWYYNLGANPQATFEAGGETFQVVARETTGDERQQQYDEHARQFPEFAAYPEQDESRDPRLRADTTRRLTGRRVRASARTFEARLRRGLAPILPHGRGRVRWCPGSADPSVSRRQTRGSVSDGRRRGRSQRLSHDRACLRRRLGAGRVPGPPATGLSAQFMIPVGLAMSAISFVAAGLSAWATTLDRQHALTSLLTSANGIVILALALVADAFPGYAVAALLLLFTWGFVARTRFVYASLRSIVVSIAFVVAIFLYRGPDSLILDVLFYVAAVVGMLLGFRIFERNRRRLFFQELIVRNQSEQLATEMAKSDQLLLNILPASIALRLREGEQPIADDYPSVTVLFGDIVGFTPLSAQLSAHQLIDVLSTLFSRFYDLVAEQGLEKIKTIGDNFMAVGGLSGEADHAARIVTLGLAMLDEACTHEVLGQPIQLRIGVNSGPVAGGVIGTRKLAFDLWGDTVNVASRLQEIGPPGRILVSEATWQLVCDQFDGEAMGEGSLRGHAGVSTYAILGPAGTRVS